MTPIACALLSAAGFYFAFGMGEHWWLAWFAAVPILWLAFGGTKPWTVFLAAWASSALGACSILRAYAGLLPSSVLAVAILAPSLLFALSIVGARRVERRLGAVAGLFAFAALWTMFDFLTSFDRGGGTISSPAGAEVGAPVLIQSASLVGYLGVTFLLGAVSAGIALGLRKRDPVPAAIALVLFAANAGYGYWRLSAPSGESMRVALVESDDVMGGINKENKPATFRAIDAYAAAIARLRDAQVQLILLPENIAKLPDAWRDQAEAKLAAAADETHATIVAGFNTDIDHAQRNVSLAFTPGAARPVTYEKRRLVPVLESSVYAPGPGPRVLANGTGLEICKDMDFQAMIRADAVATRPLLFAVPAWDFDADDWSHARIAVLRSVENGVPMARNARDGLLTLNDRYGRIVARARTVGPFTTLVGQLPLAGRGGDTLYDRIGDSFGWACLVLGLLLTGWSALPRRPVS
jgi:apolipoprotein N-acyltransferase